MSYLRDQVLDQPALERPIINITMPIKPWQVGVLLWFVQALIQIIIINIRIRIWIMFVQFRISVE